MERSPDSTRLALPDRAFVRWLAQRDGTSLSTALATLVREAVEARRARGEGPRPEPR